MKCACGVICRPNCTVWQRRMKTSPKPWNPPATARTQKKPTCWRLLWMPHAAGAKTAPSASGRWRWTAGRFRTFWRADGPNRPISAAQSGRAADGWTTSAPASHWPSAPAANGGSGRANTAKTVRSCPDSTGRSRRSWTQKRRNCQKARILNGRWRRNSSGLPRPTASMQKRRHTGTAAAVSMWNCAARICTS